MPVIPASSRLLMPTSVKVTVMIKGKETTKVASCSLDQSMFNHHSFELKLPAEALFDSEVINLDKAVEYIGESVVIKLDMSNIDEHDAYQFKGITTEVLVSNNDSDSSALILKGYSPTIFIDEGPNISPFSELKLKDIVSKVTSDAPRDMMTIKNDPSFSGKIPYVVQYKETDYDFLTRLAAHYGQWFYYDGTNMVFGKRLSGDKVNMSFRGNISDLNYYLKLVPLNFKHVTYDVEQKKNIVVSSKGEAVAGLAGHGTKVKEKSDKFFTCESLVVGVLPGVKQDELKHNVISTKAARASNAVKISGMSHVPYLHPGKIVNIKIDGSVASRTSSTTLGEFMITSVSHHTDALGNYHNYFEAIPAGLSTYTVNVPQVPTCEIQTAIVTNNNDPDKLGRVKVKMNWELQDETPWIRVSNLSSGNSFGSLFLPEVNDEVLIGFEFNDPARPYVLGSLYNGKDKPYSQSDKNDFKIIKTRSGNTILLDDTQGKEQIHILNKDAENSIILTVDGDGAITIASKGNIMLKAAKDITLEAQNIDFKADKDFSVKAEGKISAEATKDITMKATGKLKGEATQDLELKGMNFKAEGDMEAKVKGGVGATLESGAQTVVKGAMVMIN